MAEKLRSQIPGDGESHLDLRPLLRLGGWGACAVVALAIAVFAGRTDSGEQRAGTAFAAITGAQHQQELRTAGAALLARAEAEREVRRTAEAVRILAADRDRLSQRISVVEHNLEDLTGSIKRQAAAAPASTVPPPAAATAPIPAPAPSTLARPAPTPPVTVASRNEPPHPAPAAAPAPLVPLVPLDIAPKEPVAVEARAPARPPPRPAIMALIQSYASSSAMPEREPPAPSAHPTTGAAARRAEFALDLGSSPTLGGLRALWERTRARQPAHLASLRPLVSVREGPRAGSTELRLVVGPLVSAAVAARICAALVVSGVPCQPAVFEGQKLALR